MPRREARKSTVSSGFEKFSSMIPFILFRNSLSCSLGASVATGSSGMVEYFSLSRRLISRILATLASSTLMEKGFST